MFQILIFLLLAPGAAQPEANVKFRDRVQDPTPVTDKDLRPVKAPDCRNDVEVQKALYQLSLGEAGDCFIRDRTAFKKG